MADSILLDLTPWTNGTPPRVGWWAASAERNDDMRSYFDGTIWSEQVDEAASDDELDAARNTPMDPARARSIEWRGLTRDAHDWLAGELARD